MGGKLVVCSSCAVHVNAGEERCPHCGEEASSSGADGFTRAAGAALMGLALAGCPASDDTGGSVTSAAYGVPATDSFTATDSTSGDSSTTTGGGDDSSSTEGGETVGSSSSTGSGTSSGTSTGSDTDGSTGISPDYGSPATD